MIRGINRNHFEVIGLASDSENRAEVTRFLEVNDCGDLPIVFVGTDILKNYKLSFTPMTLLLRGDGKVEEVWRGKWSPNVISSASQALGVQIPIK